MFNVADKWDRIIDTNLRGYFYCAQFAGRHMLAKQKGSIIMTSSIAGALGVSGLTPYAASKGGVNQLVRTCLLYTSDAADELR